jgi:hypothetical protein
MADLFSKVCETTRSEGNLAFMQEVGAFCGRPREMTLNEFTGARMVCAAAWELLYRERGSMPEKWARQLLDLSEPTYYRYLHSLDRALPDWRDWRRAIGYSPVDDPEVAA